MEIKDIIRTKRLEHGYTMKQLADKVGVSEATVSRWESGNLATMKHTKIALLAEALCISPALLFLPYPQIDKDFHISSQEETIIKKYRQLDADGKDRINRQLDFELYQINQSAEKEERNLG